MQIPNSRPVVCLIGDLQPPAADTLLRHTLRRDALKLHAITAGRPCKLVSSPPATTAQANQMYQPVRLIGERLVDAKFQTSHNVASHTPGRSPNDQGRSSADC